SSMTREWEQSGEVVHLPAPPAAAVDTALEQLELVYAYVYARVGNRADAEDVTQQVALKAIPRLRAGASPGAIRAYLFAAARSALATFWSARFGLPEDELHEDLWVENRRPERAAERLDSLVGDLLAGRRLKATHSDADERDAIRMAARLAGARDGYPRMSSAFRRRMGRLLEKGEPAPWMSRRAALVGGVGVAA